MLHEIALAGIGNDSKILALTDNCSSKSATAALETAPDRPVVMAMAIE